MQEGRVSDEKKWERKKRMGERERERRLNEANYAPAYRSGFYRRILSMYSNERLRRKYFFRPGRRTLQPQHRQQEVEEEEQESARISISPKKLDRRVLSRRVNHGIK